MNDLPEVQKYKSMSADDVRGVGDSYKALILSQISRINYLLTLGNAKYDGATQMFSDETQALSALRGILILEAIVTPICNEEYKTDTKGLKQQLIQDLQLIKTDKIRFYLTFQKYYISIIQLLEKLNMLPQEEIEMEFE